MIASRSTPAEVAPSSGREPETPVAAVPLVDDGAWRSILGAGRGAAVVVEMHGEHQVERALTTEGLPVSPSLGPTLEAAAVPIEASLVDSRVVVICFLAISYCGWSLRVG